MKRKLFLLSLTFFYLSSFIAVPAGFAQPQADEAIKAKYVFLFIGDGMGHGQVNAAQAYKASLEGRIGFSPLTFTEFPVTGQSTTYANNRLITCSAAAGTALATGNKTNINRISMDPEGSMPYETIAEKARDAGFRVGIVTSVSIDHATPAVFYAHQPDRNMNFEIGVDLANSGFDYFAGGGFLIPDDTLDGNLVNLHALAAEKGYRVVNTAEDFQKLGAGSGKTLVLSPRTAGGASLPYALDSGPGDLTLADFTAKGITLLSGDEGFFMMVEGGKIDWACHANDAAATIHEVLAFDEAVKQALSFYEKHPKETLIIVTADHETGGLSLGHRAMKYETSLDLLKYQKSSVEELNKIVQQFRVSKSGDADADFNRMLKVLESDLGLNSIKYGTLLDEAKIDVLRLLFTESISNIPSEKSTYNEYEPFMAEAIRLLNEKAGLNWGSASHTSINVPVYAIGSGAEKFTGVTDNTDIPRFIGEVMGIQ